MLWFIYAAFFCIAGFNDNFWVVALGIGCLVMGFLKEEQQQKVSIWLFVILISTFLIIGLQEKDWGGGSHVYYSDDSCEEESYYERHAAWH